ncbi:MAG: hypothetical protein ACRDSJ_25465 [Rubrobacteraceae bacterium]
MNFLADENFPMPSVNRLREADHGVAAIASEEPAERLLDLLGQPDISITGNFTVVERDRLRQRSLPLPP